MKFYFERDKLTHAKNTKIMPLFFLNIFLQSLIWLGANDFLSEGQFVWESTGSPVQSYLNWNINEPNNLGGDEGCMHFHSSAKGQWNDLSCESFLPTMCEILYTCS
jgi:hypothetical protein